MVVECRESYLWGKVELPPRRVQPETEEVLFDIRFPKIGQKPDRIREVLEIISEGSVQLRHHGIHTSSRRVLRNQEINDAQLHSVPSSRWSIDALLGRRRSYSWR